jgi:hypothetical protein
MSRGLLPGLADVGGCCLTSCLRIECSSTNGTCNLLTTPYLMWRRFHTRTSKREFIPSGHQPSPSFQSLTTKSGLVSREALISVEPCLTLMGRLRVMNGVVNKADESSRKRRGFQHFNSCNFPSTTPLRSSSASRLLYYHVVNWSGATDQGFTILVLAICAALRWAIFTAYGYIRAEEWFRSRSQYHNREFMY